ncbi:helix-turn-helix domain-containing protein [Mucilaginibacter humi]|uniref:helix-turn-helix domain-containing protein n=1 Tax=Mucilaginibacter humi TaxID=2732510 RepID=UPI00293BD748|nr:AraC family transcriptional regulator [Mucilaginibacter humi]
MNCTRLQAPERLIFGGGRHHPEQYIIQQKIERVKELLFYDELNLSEISYKLGYSSVAHLSAQFKKVTGQTPSQFKAARSAGNARRSLDAI